MQTMLNSRTSIDLFLKVPFVFFMCIFALFFDFGISIQIKMKNVTLFISFLYPELKETADV